MVTSDIKLLVGESKLRAVEGIDPFRFEGNGPVGEDKLGTRKLNEELANFRCVCPHQIFLVYLAW